MHSGTLIHDLFAAVERAEQVSQAPPRMGRPGLSEGRPPSLAHSVESHWPRDGQPVGRETLNPRSNLFLGGRAE
jgi:hypothetical protein